MEKSDILKIIYFDETFVADYMQIIAGGELKKTTEFVTDVSTNLNASADAGFGLSTEKKGLAKIFSFLSGVSFKAETEIKSSANRKSDRIAKNILENTLLADFIALLENDNKRTKNKRCEGIEIFHNASVYPQVNSFTYLMLVAPFLSILKGQMPVKIDNSQYNLDISKLEDSINKGRGYYEFLTTIDGNEKILRFNLDAFRNNYTMSDLPKMQLTYFAIKVGKINKQDLSVEKEFEFGTQKAPQRIDYSGNIETSSNQLDVYDVVLAGVLR